MSEFYVQVFRDNNKKYNSTTVQQYNNTTVQQYNSTTIQHSEHGDIWN